MWPQWRRNMAKRLIEEKNVLSNLRKSIFLVSTLPPAEYRRLPIRLPISMDHSTVHRLAAETDIFSNLAQQGRI